MRQLALHWDKPAMAGLMETAMLGLEEMSSRVSWQVNLRLQTLSYLRFIYWQKDELKGRAAIGHQLLKWAESRH
ncbi:MAG: hypothetical protein WBD01_11600 [Salaquimonas sp.]